jgi:hypothetical protein
VQLTHAVSKRYAWLMSVEELKKTVVTLSPQEQNELTAFLFHLRHRGDVAYQPTLKARMDDKDPSHWLTPEEFEKRLDAE